MNPDVTAVQPLEDHQLMVSFTTGERRRFDVKPLLDFPIYRRLKDASYFSRAHVACGTVAWDEQCDLSPDTVYRQGQPV